MIFLLSFGHLSTVMPSLPLLTLYPTSKSLINFSLHTKNLEDLKLIHTSTLQIIHQMEEEMIALRNVMPVELAIKREMEYRAKIELMKNGRLVNLNPLVPSQVHPASHATLKRNEPCSSSTSLERRSIGLVCKICQMNFNSVNQLKQHSSTIKHKGNVLQLKKRGQNVSTPFLCELCNSSCSSAGIMDDHLRGTKHVTLLQEFAASLYT
ncbi:putative transcription factor C2H2 family [Helianthus debilis subsp. tardiflorus]